jgi:large subunit ribosomal protein L1
VQPDDIAHAIISAKAGRVEFRLDKTANIHVPLGKVSFSADDLYVNMAALMVALRKARPSGAKGVFVRKVTLTSTMGPGVRVDVNAALSMESEAA